MEIALPTGDFAGVATGIAALVAAIGGVGAAIVGINEYALKSRAQRVEIDVQLSKLLAELVPIANGRGATNISDTAAEVIAKHQVERESSPEQMAAALKGAAVTSPIGVPTQAAAIASIGYLGGEHPALRSAASRALLALEFVDEVPTLRETRRLALGMVED